MLGYPSSSYWDDLAWGAAWLYLSTNNPTYLNDAQLYFTLAETDGTQVPPNPLAWNWDNQLPGVAFLLANISQWQNETIIQQVCPLCCPSKLVRLSILTGDLRQYRQYLDA